MTNDEINVAAQPAASSNTTNTTKRLKDFGQCTLGPMLAGFIVYVVVSQFAGEFFSVPLAFMVYMLLMLPRIGRRPNE